MLARLFPYLDCIWHIMERFIGVADTRIQRRDTKIHPFLMLSILPTSSLWRHFNRAFSYRLQFAFALFRVHHSRFRRTLWLAPREVTRPTEISGCAGGDHTGRVPYCNDAFVSVFAKRAVVSQADLHSRFPSSAVIDAVLASCAHPPLRFPA